ncbi:MAG TPA: glutamyl-tRNA reductase [Polyangiaceae bacterium]|nr:glutamyl-tRNA reductase [Polyangiaceae bacterium]
MLVIGLSHRTASIEVRERVALDEDAAQSLLKHLVQNGTVAEAMVLSTCNRMELYFAPTGGDMGERAVDDALEALRFTRADIGKLIYLHAGSDALRHLFRVATSLDSLVVGEPQILGQLKLAFERARALGVVGAQLNRAATRAFRAAKRVRTETSVGSGQVSVATVALDLACQIFDDLRGRRVALVGAGEMGEAIAQLLQQSGAHLSILGRNEQRVQALARRVGAEAHLLSELERTLVDIDVVVTSTSASLPIITLEQVKGAVKRRRGRDLFFVDVAVPRDVDERVGKLDGVYLYNVDDLSSVVAQTQAHRQQGAQHAEYVISEELAKLEQHEEMEQVVPTVSALYRRFSEVLRAEAERSLQGGLRELTPEEREALVRLLDAATNKLLHHPVTTLKRWAVERPLEVDATLELMHEMFLSAEEERPHRSAPNSAPTSSLPKHPVSSRAAGLAERELHLLAPPATKGTG